MACRWYWLSRRRNRLALDDERLLLVVVPAIGAIASRVDAVAALAEEGAEQREKHLLAVVLVVGYYAYCVYGKSKRNDKETEPLMPVATATPMT